MEPIISRRYDEDVPTKATTKRRPPPQSEEEFELLVVDVARVRLGNPSLARFGRRGQAQDGVDGFDPIATEGQGVVWQATLKEQGVETKLVNDLALMDAKLAYQPGRFVLALGIERDVKIQLAAAELSARRLKEGKCAVEVWFWEDLYDVVISNESLHQKFYPDDAQPARGPALRLHWATVEDRKPKGRRGGAETEEDEAPPVAVVDAEVLELPVVSVSLDDLKRTLLSEISECEQLRRDEKASRFRSDLAKYQERCERFLAGVADEETFREWYVREHWKLHARRFSLRVENDVTAPATGIHARVEAPRWLKFFADNPETEGPLFPRRPHFLLDRMNSMDRLFFTPELAIGMPIELTRPSLRMPFRESEARLDGDDLDVTVVSLSHQHQLDLPDHFSALAMPVSPGVRSVDYEVFSIEGLDWVKAAISVRVIAHEKRFDYDYRIRDALGLDVIMRKL